MLGREGAARIMQNLVQLIQEYLETLDDEEEDEFYMSDRGFAKWQLEKFVYWLIERPNTASRPTVPCAPTDDDSGESRRGGLCPDR